MNDMIITIHQPEHMPWFGFFHKIMNVDLYVVLDSVQFRKNYFQNRNLIVGTNDIQWITVPVELKNHTNKTIKEVRIANTNIDWKSKYLNSIRQSYGKYPYFNLIFNNLEEIIYSDVTTISQMNIAIIKYFLKSFNSQVMLLLSSELHCNGESSDLILNICKAVGATTYLAGISSCNYLNYTKFNENSITVLHHEFVHPIYTQRRTISFVPNLSILDMVMNIGFKETLEFIMK